MFPYVSNEQRNELLFTICYHQHEGSGLTWTRADFLDAEIGEAVWFAERLQDQREAEVSAMRAANKK